MRFAVQLMMIAVAMVALAAVESAAEAAKLTVVAGDVLTADFAEDKAPAAGASQVRIVGVRNGSFSGKVTVYSDEAISGLKARVTDLTGPGGAKIPASAVTVRYALEWGDCVVASGSRFVDKWGFLGLLTELAPAKVEPLNVPVRKGEPARQASPVVPVWFTVRVPAGAAAGEYKGKVTVGAVGATETSVPVVLKVIDWKLPDVDKYSTRVEMVHSPDSLALQYEVKMWSEKHWELISGSLSHMSSVGSRVVHIPLIGRTNMGNEESMVRWRKVAGGKYEYDFTIMERYLDTAEKAMGGKPTMVVLGVWENYMMRADGERSVAAADHEQQRIIDILEKKDLLVGRGPGVTMVDGAGNVSLEYLAHYTDAESARPQWQPLMTELKSRLSKRGLWDVSLLGLINDCWPTKAEVEFFKSIAPELDWAMYCHFGSGNVYGLAKGAYRAQALAVKAPTSTSLKGWNRPDMLVRYNRLMNFGSAPLTTWRHWAEFCISGDQRGVGRLGADYWPVVKDGGRDAGRRVWERYPESTWRNLGIYVALLGAAEEGPVATTRFELFREGLQEAEARIAIERALTDPALAAKLGDALVKRSQELLDERIARMNENPAKTNRQWYSWTIGDGWQERSEKLYQLAAEVSAKVGGGR